MEGVSKRQWTKWLWLLLPGGLLIFIFFYAKETGVDLMNLIRFGRVSLANARLYAENAGFSGIARDTIVAIAKAESGLDPNQINENKDVDGNVKSTDRGILQINDKYWPQFGDLEVFNPVTAFRDAWIISRQGTYFGDWVTYKTGAYLKYMPSEDNS